MKARILKHKTKKGYHGAVIGGILSRTGETIVPQLFPDYADKEWINKSVKHIDTLYVKSLDDFEIIDVEINSPIKLETMDKDFYIKFGSQGPILYYRGIQIKAWLGMKDSLVEKEAHTLCDKLNNKTENPENPTVCKYFQYAKDAAKAINRLNLEVISICDAGRFSEGVIVFCKEPIK